MMRNKEMKKEKKNQIIVPSCSPSILLFGLRLYVELLVLFCTKAEIEMRKERERMKTID